MEEKSRGNGKVLIVDDDELLREAAVVMLEMLGYDTVAAADGLEAIARYREHRDSIVLLDVSMSGMDGIACMQELKRIDPEARIVLSSGYMAEDAAIADAREWGQVGFLQKPYGPQELDSVLGSFSAS